MTACKPSAKPDNPASRYVENLQQDAEKAHKAADLANKKIAEQNAAVQVE